MDELIYQFLLQAGYPRASVIADPTLLTSGDNGKVPEEASTYVIVDPETAERLAAIEVVDAIDGDTLQLVASQIGQYARRLGGREVQGFVIRVDPRGRTDAEQVQFFRVWPNPMLQQLSAKTFPDLDALRVARRLTLASRAPVEPEAIDPDEDAEADTRGEGESPPQPVMIAAPRTGVVRRYVPAIALILIAGTDWYLLQTRGVSLVNLSQAVLAVGAAAVIALSA